MSENLSSNNDKDPAYVTASVSSESPKKAPKTERRRFIPRPIFALGLIGLAGCGGLLGLKAAFGDNFSLDKEQNLSAAEGAVVTEVDFQLNETRITGNTVEVHNVKSTIDSNATAFGKTVTYDQNGVIIHRALVSNEFCQDAGSYEGGWNEETGGAEVHIPADSIRICSELDETDPMTTVWSVTGSPFGLPASLLESTVQSVAPDDGFLRDYLKDANASDMINMSVARSGVKAAAAQCAAEVFDLTMPSYEELVLDNLESAAEFYDRDFNREASFVYIGTQGPDNPNEPQTINLESSDAIEVIEDFESQDGMKVQRGEAEKCEVSKELTESLGLDSPTPDNNAGDAAGINGGNGR